MARKKTILAAEPEEPQVTDPETPVEEPVTPETPTAEEPTDPVEPPAGDQPGEEVPPAADGEGDGEKEEENKRFFETFPCGKSGYNVHVMRRRRRQIGG